MDKQAERSYEVVRMNTSWQPMYRIKASDGEMLGMYQSKSRAQEAITKLLEKP